MIATCPVCRKGFEVMWPHLWAYREGKHYLCTWKCLRRMREGSEEEPMEDKRGSRLTEDQKEQAVDIALKGGSPLRFLKECGCKNPSTAWQSVLRWAAKQDWDDDVMSKLPVDFRGKGKVKVPEQVPEVKIDGPIRIQTVEPEKVTFVDTIPLPKVSGIEYRMTGISTEAGDFQYFRKQGFIDWTTLDGTCVSMNLEEWKALMKVLPEVIRLLGVEL